MKKKIINGLLFAVVLVTATSSFVSCKDYDGYNELQEKYLTLQKAFDLQVAAMNDYVLKTTFNTAVGEINGKIEEINKETGYSAAELAAKGTIKKRLDDLEANYGTLSGELADMNDPSKVGSLAYQIAQNNIAIATAQGLISQVKGLAERDSAYLRSLLAGWDNGGTLGDMVSEASQLLIALKNDTAKYNFAYDTLSTYYQKWNEAVKLAEQASQFVGTNVKVQGKEISSLQDMADAYDNAIADLQDQIDALKEDVESILDIIKNQVTGIEIQATNNPLFGTFAYPIDVQSNILAAYYGKFENPVKFPAGDEGAQKNTWVGNTPAVLSTELADINAPSQTFAAGIQMKEGAGNAGKLYLTVNPSNVVMDGKEFTLRTSDDKVSKVVLSPLETCTEQLKWGYSRAATNGFYVATAEIKKDNVEDVALNFDLMSIANSVQDIMQDWSKASAAQIVKLLWAVSDGLKVDAPRLGVQAQWKDAQGWQNYVSKYDLAAFSIKPVGYDFLYDMDFSGGIVKFQNKITAKEKAFAQDLINQIAQALAFSLKLPVTTETNIEIDAAGNVYVVIPNGAFSNGSNVLVLAQGAVSTSPDVPSTNLYLPVLPNEAAGGYKINITPLITSLNTAINSQLGEVNTTVNTEVNKILDKIINLENKIFGKVASVAKNPNRYVQPALLAKCDQLGYFYPSRIYLAPTQVKKGQKIMFFPTTLTGEVIAPAFKKYVAVTGAWNVADMSEDRGAAQFNTGVLNTIFDGDAYNLQNGFEYTVNAPAGTVLEFTFECLGYNGKVAGKKYYIEVYE